MRTAIPKGIARETYRDARRHASEDESLAEGERSLLGFSCCTHLCSRGADGGLARGMSEGGGGRRSQT